MEKMVVCESFFYLFTEDCLTVTWKSDSSSRHLTVLLFWYSVHLLEFYILALDLNFTRM